MSSPPPPAIILVRPQMGENIGAAARAMMNFGLEDLRIVAPRDGWPNPKAEEMAAHAKGIIERANVYPGLPEALHDRHFVVATTARARSQSLPVHTAREAARHISNRPERSAILFGPENNGLSNADMACAHAAMTIPTHPDNASLNIAQCVVIAAYEWYAAQAAAPAFAPSVQSPATQGEIAGLYLRLEKTLAAHDYFHAERQALQEEQLRRLLVGAALSSTDVQAFHGIVKALAGE